MTRHPIRLFLPALAGAFAAVLAVAPAAAADYVQAAGSTLAFATQYDGETFTGTFPGFATKLNGSTALFDIPHLRGEVSLGFSRTGRAFDAAATSLMRVPVLVSAMGLLPLDRTDLPIPYVRVGAGGAAALASGTSSLELVLGTLGAELSPGFAT